MSTTETRYRVIRKDGSPLTEAAFGRRPIATIGLLGASTEANCGDPSPLSGPYPVNAQLSDYGYWTYAAYRLGWAAPRLIRQEGVSGDTSASILARTPTVLSTGRQPDAWIVGSGIFGNDFLPITGISIAKSIENATAILDQVRESGRILIIQTAQPHGVNARAGLVLGEYRERQAKVNEFLRRYATVNGCLLNDVERLVTDGLSGEWRALMSGDDLHPYKLGSQVIGFALAQLLTPYLHAGDTGPCNAQDPTDAMGGVGFMAGTVGQTSAPTGWAVADNRGSYGESRVATYTQALAARADGLGNRWTVTLTSAGAIALFAYANTSFEGQAFAGAVELDSGGTWGGKVYDVGMYVQPYGVAQQGVALNQPSHAAQDFAVSPKRTMPDLGAGVLRTPPIQRNGSAAAGPYTAMTVVLWGEAGAAITLSRARMRAVTS